jgi:hypothetical protein
MKAIRAALAYLLENTRPQFHPAVMAVYLVVYYVVTLGLALTLLFRAFHWLGWGDYEIDFSLWALFAGLMMSAELVRGNVKVWLGKQPDEWSFVAIGAGGGAAGALFAGYIALMWGAPGAFESAATIAAGAGVWLLIGTCLYWEERKKKRGAARV